MSATAGGAAEAAQGTTQATNGAANGSASAPWYSSFAEDVRGVAEIKQWKGPEDAVRSYAQLEKFRGVPPERLLMLPDKEDAPEWAEIHGKLGRPAKPEEYGIEGLPPELAAAVHKEGLTTRQVKNLFGVLSAQAQAAQQAQEETSNQQLAQSVAALKAEWGKEYEPNAAAVDRAVAHMGMEEADLLALRGAWGFEKAMKFFARIGHGLGEDEFVGGDNAAATTRGGFGLTPEAARAKYAQLENDPEHQRKRMSPNKAERMAAAAELQELANLFDPSGSLGSRLAS